MNPQQGAGQLPFRKDILVEDPCSSLLVLGATRDVVIRERIGRCQPLLELFEEPLP